MNGSRSINLAVVLSLLLHATLLALGIRGGTERTLLMALYGNKGVANQLNGEPGELSILLLPQDSQSSRTSPDTPFDFQKNERRLASAAPTGVTEPFSESKSSIDPVDPANSTPRSSPGASRSVQHSMPLDDYSAQIAGRIERAWVRPLAHFGDAFHCEAHISQTPQGEVREVTLTQCDGDDVWRQSIIRAIRYASPLPAPPNEKAFRSVLTLNFQAEPMSPTLLARLLSVSEELSRTEHPSDSNHMSTVDTRISNRKAVKPHTP